MRKFTKTGFPKKWKILADTKENHSQLIKLLKEIL